MLPILIQRHSETTFIAAMFCWQMKQTMLESLKNGSEVAQ